MSIFNMILLGFLVVCAISVSFSKNLLNSILIYMSYSRIWLSQRLQWERELHRYCFLSH